MAALESAIRDEEHLGRHGQEEGGLIYRLQAIRCNAATLWPDAIPSTPARAVYYVTGERG
jgi:hypothetical protein